MKGNMPIWMKEENTWMIRDFCRHCQCEMRHCKWTTIIFTLRNMCVCVWACVWALKIKMLLSKAENFEPREREKEGKGIVVNLQHNTNIVFVRILSFRIHSFSVYSFFLFRLTEIITDHGKEWTHTHTHRGKKEQKSNEKWKEEGVMNG